MIEEFKKELKRSEGNTEQWATVKRLEVSFDEFIKKVEKVIKLNKEIGLSEKHNLIVEINKFAGNLI